MKHTSPTGEGQVVGEYPQMFYHISPWVTDTLKNCYVLKITNEGNIVRYEMILVKKSEKSYFLFVCLEANKKLEKNNQCMS